MIHGPPGLGKSRLARESLVLAERASAVTGWVQATRSAATVPLGAFASVIGPDVRSDDRFELIQLSMRALHERAAGAPLVIALDDAQWLDPTSAALALHPASTATALLVTTVRSGERCPDAIVSLWKDAGAPRLELGLLSGEETSALAEEIAGGPVERGARSWVYETSGGNALYVRELVVGALESGALEQVNGLWRMSTRPVVSDSLSELIAEPSPPWRGCIPAGSTCGSVVPKEPPTRPRYALSCAPKTTTTARVRPPPRRAAGVRRDSGATRYGPSRRPCRGLLPTGVPPRLDAVAPPPLRRARGLGYGCGLHQYRCARGFTADALADVAIRASAVSKRGPR